MWAVLQVLSPAPAAPAPHLLRQRRVKYSVPPKPLQQAAAAHEYAAKCHILAKAERPAGFKPRLAGVWHRAHAVGGHLLNTRARRTTVLAWQRGTAQVGRGEHRQQATHLLSVAMAVCSASFTAAYRFIFLRGPPPAALKC